MAKWRNKAIESDETKTKPNKVLTNVLPCGRHKNWPLVLASFFIELPVGTQRSQAKCSLVTYTRGKCPWAHSRNNRHHGRQRCAIVFAFRRQLLGATVLSRTVTQNPLDLQYVVVHTVLALLPQTTLIERAPTVRIECVGQTGNRQTIFRRSPNSRVRARGTSPTAPPQ